MWACALTCLAMEHEREQKPSQRRDRSDALLPVYDAHGIKSVRGHSRLPREAAAEISRPRTRIGEGTLCPHPL
jgi:hypothetical protein